MSRLNSCLNVRTLIVLAGLVFALWMDTEGELIKFPLCMFFPVASTCGKDNYGQDYSRPSLKETPVFVLHGLGERTWTMELFKFSLKLWGWKNVHLPHWPANTCLLEDCLDALDKEMQLHANKSVPIFVIGNSMGGVMAYHLHTRDWNIIASYSIAAPIKGAAMYRWLKETLPFDLFNWMRQPGHLYLERTEQPPPPEHPWYTIGFNFAYGFDGNVFLTDMPSENHITFPGTHYSLSMDPLTWHYLNQEMVNHLKLMLNKSAVQ